MGVSEVDAYGQDACEEPLIGDHHTKAIDRALAPFVVRK
jgi:hypothetical protein